MASMKDIKRRKGSIQSTQQITKAMKLVSTVKLQKAKGRAEQTNPYFNYMYQTVSSMLAKSGNINHPYLKSGESTKKAVVVITSNRGLAGGYNSNIVKLIPGQFQNVQQFLMEQAKAYPQIEQQLASVQIDWESLLKSAMDFVTAGTKGIISGGIGAVTSIVSGVTNFFIGFIFSIYVLFQKETLARQTKKILYAFTKEKTAQKVLRVVRLANTTFASFLSGQCLEACILGTMFCVTMLVIRLPYALLIGIVIAITALIPIVGAFIGCVVGIILIGLVNPVKAVIFVIMFFVLQQIEGNLIYPHVVGSSVGLPGMWVLMAVTVGGSLFGIVGILTFIPICSVCYALFRLFVNERLKEKREI